MEGSSVDSSASRYLQEGSQVQKAGALHALLLEVRHRLLALLQFFEKWVLPQYVPFHSGDASSGTACSLDSAPKYCRPNDLRDYKSGLLAVTSRHFSVIIAKN